MEDIPALAVAVAGRIADADCQPEHCKVIVGEFTLPDGNTSAFGLRVAETLSRELATKEYGISVIDRKTLRDFESKYRVLAQADHRATVRWTCDALGARFMVFGTTEEVGNGFVRVSSQLIDTDSDEWMVYRAIATLDPPTSVKDLDPVDPLPDLPPITRSATGEKVEQFGSGGVTSPSCFYMPNPPYSDGARKLKISGWIMAEAVINSEGRLESIRMVRGLPGGLNGTTMEIMRSWRCHPSLKEGKPVPVVARFEMNFRMY